MKHNIVDKADYSYYFKKKMKFVTDRDKHEYMEQNREKCLLSAIQNPNENWFANILKNNKIKHKRQSIWGYRIYDFWIHKLGCAIEIDGADHDERYDRYRDIYNYLRSGIVVLRVRNRNEQDAADAVAFIRTLDTWKERRHWLRIEGKGVHPVNLTNPNDRYWDP
jgi:very-short-patch-repair endonuclease